MKHSIDLCWIPGQKDGEGYYQIRCIVCGAILVKRVDIKDDCTKVDTLRFIVTEDIKARDKIA